MVWIQGSGFDMVSEGLNLFVFTKLASTKLPSAYSSYRMPYAIPESTFTYSKLQDVAPNIVDDSQTSSW